MNESTVHHRITANWPQKLHEVEYVIAQVNKSFPCRRDRSRPHLLFAHRRLLTLIDVFVCEHLCLGVLFTVRMRSLHNPERCCGNTENRGRVTLILRETRRGKTQRSPTRRERGERYKKRIIQSQKDFPGIFFQKPSKDSLGNGNNAAGASCCAC